MNEVSMRKRAEFKLCMRGTELEYPTRYQFSQM